MSQEAQSPIVGVGKESFAGENRVALVPSTVGLLTKAGLEVIVEAGAGLRAGFPDERYASQGAKLFQNRADIFSKASVILQVRAAGANPVAGRADLELLRDGQTLIGMCDPLSEPGEIAAVAKRRVCCFSLELLPRITRAQSMDVLSSMSTIAGYKAVLLAADALPRIFPMLMTAAGTLAPAKVFIVGAGVAGLQAIATARRLGAVVRSYDVRPEVKEQVESLGAKFVEFELETDESEQVGGYAKAMDDEFYRRQRELMGKVVAESDVVITTAAIPGKQAPVLVTAEMVKGMSPGSVIVDLAAERGGNCELTRANETILANGVQILGPVNLAATVPFHASEMYAKNISTFLLHLISDGVLELNMEDEIIRDTLLTRDGEVVQPRVRELLGLEPLQAPEVAKT